MAIPRVFVSSTYYDLRHIRNGIELFIDSMGYDSVLFESGDIPFSHEFPLDISCYSEIGLCHILILIIGGRFGSQISGGSIKLEGDEMENHYKHYNSITQRELETALAKNIPVYTFVEKSVSAEYRTYKENKTNNSIRYAHVSSVNIFRLLDDIYKRDRNNLTRDFEHLDDIISWLKIQWAGLFGDFLVRQSNLRTLETLQDQLSSLKNVTEALKGYSESIIRQVSPDGEKIIKLNQQELLKRETLSKFANTKLIEHLRNYHGITLPSLVEIFRDSQSFVELKSSLKNKNVVCSVLDDVGQEVNRVRNILGSNPLPDVASYHMPETHIQLDSCSQ